MLKKSCLALLLVLLVPLAGSQETDPRKLKQDRYWMGHHSHPELAEASHEYIEADNRMNALYKILMGIYEKSEDDTGEYYKTELVKAQTAWLAYRNLAAKAETPGGKDFVYYQNMAELTEQRVERLKGLLHYLSSGMSGRDYYETYEPLATEGINKFEEMEKSGQLNEPSPEKLDYQARHGKR